MGKGELTEKDLVKIMKKLDKLEKQCPPCVCKKCGSRWIVVPTGPTKTGKKIDRLVKKALTKG